MNLSKENITYLIWYLNHSMNTYRENKLVVLFDKINPIVLESFRFAGILTNLLMLVVFYQGNLRKLSFSTYIRCLAFFCACQNFYYLFSSFSTLLADDYAQNSELLCRLKVFLYFFLPQVCAWLEVIASLDRFLTIVYPFKFRFKKKPIFKRSLVTLVILINSGCNLDAFIWDQLKLIDFRPFSSFTQCQIRIHYDKAHLDFAIGAAVPFILMTILSVATFVGVFKAHQRVKSSGKEDHSRHTRNRDIRFGVTMIAINVVFIIFNLPYRMYMLLVNHNVTFFDNGFTQSVFKNILIDFYQVYYVIIFFVQLGANKQVRKELVVLLSRVLRRFRSL